MPAQALLVPHDFVDRRQYLHARRTLTRLLELGAVPIVNENDAIASDEIRYGDNDRIAALVAHNIGAGVLVLLTDLDGLYTADPRADADAAARRRASASTTRCWRSAPAPAAAAGGAVAWRASWRRRASPRGPACATVIANAARPGVLAGAIAGEPVGTTLRGRTAASCRRASCGSPSPPHVAGTVTVDDGARRALVERQTSLLPAGVVDVAGEFGEGDTVDVADADGVAFARGMVFVEAAQLRRVAGRHTSDLPAGMAHEVIHRDDLVAPAGVSRAVWRRIERVLPARGRRCRRRRRRASGRWRCARRASAAGSDAVARRRLGRGRRRRRGRARRAAR